MKVGGHRSGATRRKSFLLVVPLNLFGSKSTISRFGERFRDGQYSLVMQFLVCCFSTHGATGAQPVVKVGARASRALWSRRHYWGSIWGRTNQGSQAGWETFWNFCFEMVHFGAKVTNAVGIYIITSIRRSGRVRVKRMT